MKKKKILIVGGTGFIGYHLSKFCLKKKWSVTSFSKNPPKKIRKISSVKYIRGDLCKLKDVKKIKINFNYVVNLGGYVDHSKKKKTYQSHYLGCKNLCDYFIDKNIDSFVQMGSGGEYGKIKSPHLENSKCNPKSTYAKAKLLSTKYLLEMYKKKKFPCTVLRLYQSYGERQDENRLIPIVITSCLEKKKFPCSEGKQFRDFIHINDVVQAIIKAIEKNKAKGQIFNLGSGELINIKNLIKNIKNIVGSGEPDFGKVKLRSEENLKHYPSIKKIKKFLNWNPKINFNNGLYRTIKYYKKTNLQIN